VSTSIIQAGERFVFITTIIIIINIIAMTIIMIWLFKKTTPHDKTLQ
jgi:flagellar biogenesis protein FliO